MTEAVTTRRRRHCKNIYPHKQHEWLVIRTPLELDLRKQVDQVGDEVIEYDTFVCPGVVRA